MNRSRDGEESKQGTEERQDVHCKEITEEPNTKQGLNNGARSL